ncbi:MAG: SufE family protein [Bacteroidetes bacterium]|jgi:cysteine desulfuration protein SufE|nr:SufE family protein [Bacteroidota bacterium]
MAASDIKQTEEEIISDFDLFEDWTQKYEYIIEMGLKLPPIDEKYKNDNYRIKGCQSSVWLNSYEKGGLLYFEADSDSAFVKGEIALLIKVLSGRTPQEIMDAELNFIDAIGLRQHIAVTRANGLASMIKQIKTYALAGINKP